MTDPIIGFAGLTHLGLNSALGAASKGFQTIGWDDAPGLVNQLKQADFPINEPRFDTLFQQVRDRITFTSEMADLNRCDVLYLAIDVPTDNTGKSDLSPVEALLDQLAQTVSNETTIVILSQVPPGFTRSMRGKFEKLYYQVETLVFGRAVERATQPERTIVGADNPSDPLDLAYEIFLKSFDCPILQMRYESAELCKISINCFLVASVSTTNALSNVCEKIGADWDEIEPALRLDPRIGQFAYLKPGLGISGGNLERDLRNVVEIAAELGVDVGPIQEYRRFSDVSKDWAWHALSTALGGTVAGKTIGILGLAYKENTHSTKNSPALRLIANLVGATVRVHDPIVPTDAVPGTNRMDSIEACIEGCDAVCIMTPWDAYRGLDPSMLAEKMTQAQLIDPYNLTDAAAAKAAGLVLYVRGRPPIDPL